MLMKRFSQMLIITSATASVRTKLCSNSLIQALRSSRATYSSLNLKHHHLEYTPSSQTQTLLETIDPHYIDYNVQILLDWFSNKKSILCITGAGISTESGVPDYRGINGSFRKGHKPMVHDDFMSKYSQRQRYWGRSMVGWKEFAESKPNNGHAALVQLEKDLRVLNPKVSIITQNVDGLHLKAGSEKVIELHGNTHVIKCMNCGHLSCRNDFQEKLLDVNNDFLSRLNQSQNPSQENEMHQQRPDGDTYIPTEDFSDVTIPSCTKCNTGFLKPNVVFFGDNVPKSTVHTCYEALEEADGLLCIGTSLAVYSAFRFVQEADKKHIDLCILNMGPTRAEQKGFDLTKVESPIGATLDLLVNKLKNKK